MIGFLLGAMTMVTGYACDPAAGQPYCGLTASGLPVGPGVAACASDIPFGTRLAVDGLGIVTCADRYRSGLSDRVDVWVPTVADAYRITGFRWVVAA